MLGLRAWLLGIQQRIFREAPEFLDILRQQKDSLHQAYLGNIANYFEMMYILNIRGRYSAVSGLLPMVSHSLLGFRVVEPNNAKILFL